ncbi:hypothetical protein BLOT_007065 [Blomia tropicalis]|nr:hypothetical protein BLOT_007065 [Blomia tropicalis]
MCCNRTHLEDPVYHPACRPIIIPRRDPFYQRFNRRCNNFVRNAVGPKNNCNLGFREQTNVITSFLDASTVYGSEANRSSIVRTFRDGLLRVSEINRRQFLPYDTMNNSIACAVPRNMRLSGNAQRRCVFAGDVRVNQQFGILTLQLLFLREHNRLARQLKKINSHWNDEKLYQEARRIVGAEIQHITYNEWLPLALGRSVMNEAGLFPQQRGFCNGYDPQINPSIINEFAAAAFRWHSLVQGNYQLMDENGRVKQEFRMRNVFNNPALLYRDGAIDEATYGLLTNRAESFDPIFVDDLKNFLFPAANASFGMDLISINIQRGRDHGTPPYNQIRRACGLPIVRDFSDLDAFIRPGMAEKFAQIYDHVDDIDLFVGGVNEIPLSGRNCGTYIRLCGRRTISSIEISIARDTQSNSIWNYLSQWRSYKRNQPFSMIAKSRLNNNVGCDKIPQFNLKNWYDDDGYSRRG